MPAGDKRRDERIILSAPIIARSRDYLLRPEDASFSGLRVETPVLFKKGDKLGLSLSLPANAEPLEAVANVVWSEDSSRGRFKTGICLEDMSAIDRARWIEFLERQREKILNTAFFWEEEDDAGRIKKNIEAYLFSLGKKISLVREHKNPFADFWGIEQGGRPVLIYVYNQAESGDVAKIIGGLDWFLNKEKGNKQREKLSFKTVPLVLVIAFRFSEGFLSAFKYIKPLPLELLQVKLIASRKSRGILARRIPFYSALEEDSGSVMPSPTLASPAEEESFSHLDKEHQKILRWLSKI